MCVCVCAACPSPFVAVVAVVQGKTSFEVAKHSEYSASDIEEMEVRWLRLILSTVMMMMIDDDDDDNDD